MGEIILKIQKLSNTSKITIRRTTQVSGHDSLKMYFCIFEGSQGKHNRLDFHHVFCNIFHQLQSLYAQNLT